MKIIFFIYNIFNKFAIMERGIIFGVCEKLEKQTGIDAWIFRLLFLFTACHGGILVYCILALLL